jgi:hypothetical protein
LSFAPSAASIRPNPFAEASLLTAAEPDLSRAIQEQEDRLLREFADPLGAGLVRDQFRGALDALTPARVQIYLPVLAYRITRDRLRAQPRRSVAAAA